MAQQRRPGPAPGSDRPPAALGDVLATEAKAALARWVLHKRRQRRHGTPAWPTPHDEATHPWDGRRRFAEDYTFIAVQPRLALVLRLEWLPGRESHRVWVTVLREDGVLALPGGQIVRRDDRGDRWRAAGMSIDCVTPLRSWEIRYSGKVAPVSPLAEAIGEPRRCSLDLQFSHDGDTFTPGGDDDPDLIARRLGEATWDARLLQSVRRVQNRGYVQLGRIEGSLVLGDELVAVRASAWRQHTWGVRDFGASDRAYQCFFATADGTRGWVHRARFPFVTLEGGFVDRGGQRHAVRELAATFERRDDRAPARASLDLRTHAAPIDPLTLEIEMRSDLAFVVDGRGLVELGLFSMHGGWGVWGGQRRALPRAGFAPRNR